MKKNSKTKSRAFFTFKTLNSIYEIPITGNAREIFLRRYALKNKESKPAETMEEAFMRVANHVANGEKTTTLKNEYTKHFYNLMADRRFIPNTPTWSGSKTKLGQLAACFVLPISDDMGKDSEGIFSTLRDAALIQQVGGGNGFSFSNLRPKGDLVGSSNGRASGPVSFMQIYDVAFGNIAQGGTRRGANMAVLRIDHPDIFEFISCKATEGKIANFNISVGITDKFMEAVKNNSPFDLINPHTKEVAKTVDARELFNEIVNYAYKNGEPGILFLDTANKQNPVPEQYTLEATNPCGEQWLGPYENCCLGHINISQSVSDEGKIDWEHLKESVILGTRFLDDVVTQNNYVPAVPKLRENALRNRRIGLGFMGLADSMYKMGIRYGSEESLDFASQVTEFIRYYSMLASIELAKEKGAFPGIKQSIYNPKKFRWEIPSPLFPHKLKIDRPKLNWEELEGLLKKFGIRNSTQLTVAPTGTTATVFDVEGYGCEPVFALAYSRNVYQSAGHQENLKLTYVSPSFNKALMELDLEEDKKTEIVEMALTRGSIQDAEIAPESLRKTFVVSADIKSEEHVLMQAVIQRFVDNSISKTINFPETATKEDIAEAYFKAWEYGCKGLTVYITGSRKEVVLETKETSEKNSMDKTALLEQKELPGVSNEDIKRPRPTVVVGRTHVIMTPFGKAFVTVNRNGETGRCPFEVFINIGKAGTDTAALAEALGRLLSGWLRSSDDPDKALEEMAEQLSGIGGSGSVGFGINRVKSIPDAVSKVLYKEVDLTKQIESSKEHILLNTQQKLELEKNENLETEEVIANSVFKNAYVCPSCNNMTLVETEGCVKCFTCNFSRC